MEYPKYYHKKSKVIPKNISIEEAIKLVYKDEIIKPIPEDSQPSESNSSISFPSRL